MYGGLDSVATDAAEAGGGVGGRHELVTLLARSVSIEYFGNQINLFRY